MLHLHGCYVGLVFLSSVIALTYRLELVHPAAPLRPNKKDLGPIPGRVRAFAQSLHVLSMTVLVSPTIKNTLILQSPGIELG